MVDIENTCLDIRNNLWTLARCVALRTRRMEVVASHKLFCYEAKYRAAPNLMITPPPHSFTVR